MNPSDLPFPRARLHRATFRLAAIYNIVWGTFTCIYPGWLTDFAGMEPMRYPELFACLGMVVGLYGIIYWQVARDLERGALLALVGLMGKVLGPIGITHLLITGAWPLKAGILCLTNDLIWWIPFGLYLWDWRGRGMRAQSSP